MQIKNNIRIYKFILNFILIISTLCVYGQGEYYTKPYVSLGGAYAVVNNGLFGSKRNALPQFHIATGANWVAPKHRTFLDITLNLSSQLSDKFEPNDPKINTPVHKMDSYFRFAYARKLGKSKHFLGGTSGINWGNDRFDIDNETYEWYSRGYFSAFAGAVYHYETNIGKRPFSFKVELPLLSAFHDWGNVQATETDTRETYKFSGPILIPTQYFASDVEAVFDISPSEKVVSWAIVYRARYDNFRYYQGFPRVQIFSQTLGLRLYY